MSFDGVENDSSVGGRQTPISQRRPLQRINLNTTVLSPTKRRRQSLLEGSSQNSSPVKLPPLVFEDSPSHQPQVDRQAELPLDLVFGFLDVRHIIERIAPSCKLWREVAHSEELWTLLRRHARLLDQLVVIEKLVERRSKGRLFRCRRFGSEGMVLLRIVDLELTNAGKDDGIPTSFLREAALLSKLKHPNIIQHLGAEIVGKRGAMCTEWVSDSFSSWIRRLEAKSVIERQLEIRGHFRQLVCGLSYVHHNGIMHRNLKPDNVFIDAHGTVKLGDFTTTRMLDIPFQAYTPEDPKERDRSGREMRRLWYRAPELILRDEIYGPKVDTWSVGCLIAEAATGKALFQSDSEIDHLFRIFRLIGTPTVATWPDMATMRHFSPKFPLYTAFSFAQVSDAACQGSESDKQGLLRQAQPDRLDILQNMLTIASVLGPDGMHILEKLLTIPPGARYDADACLRSKFLSSTGSPTVAGEASVAEQRRYLVSPSPCSALDMVLDGTPGDEPPPVSLPSSFISSEMAWSILCNMQQKESTHMSSSSCSSAGASLISTPRLPPGFDVQHRAALVDLIVGLAVTLNLTDLTLHIAVAVVDKYLSLQESSLAEDAFHVVGATCLKVADVFAEQSKEYYKQENTVEYAEATLHHTTPEQMLCCEKDVLPRLGFDIHLPTIHWFLQCYLAYGRFTQKGGVGKTSAFIADLMLLDHDLLSYTASLRAQCAFLLSIFLVQQAQMERRKPAATVTEAALDGCSEYLQHWDENVRNKVCSKNVAIDTAMCLQASVRMLVVMRREWKAAKLNAVETKHAELARSMAYPERFPVSRLARHILPDSQRGIIPE